MASYFEGLFNRGSMPALVATMSFTQARHRMIAENVANIGTPGYKAKHVDTAGFQRALGEALEKRGGDPNKPFIVKSDEVSTTENGGLKVTPSTRPGRNLVFHDGTNTSIEREMSDMASNGLLHEMTSRLLMGKVDGLRKAIAGRV